MCVSCCCYKNDHKLGGLDQHRFIPYSSGGQKFEIGPSRLKSRCRQGCHHLELQGESISSQFQLREATLANGPLLPFQNRRWLLESLHVALTATVLPSSPTLKDPHDLVGPTWVIQDLLPILKSLEQQP